jgi:hypothetical protein
MVYLHVRDRGSGVRDPLELLRNIQARAGID